MYIRLKKVETNNNQLAGEASYRGGVSSGGSTSHLVSWYDFTRKKWKEKKKKQGGVYRPTAKTWARPREKIKERNRREREEGEGEKKEETFGKIAIIHVFGRLVVTWREGKVQYWLKPGATPTAGGSSRPRRRRRGDHVECFVSKSTEGMKTREENKIEKRRKGGGAGGWGGGAARLPASNT